MGTRALVSVVFDGFEICCDFIFFFFNDTATTEIYTLSLHDALPIWLQIKSAKQPLVLEKEGVTGSLTCVITRYRVYDTVQ